MDKVKVMIVDDQSISRQLFEIYVTSSEKYELVYSVETAAFADAFALKKKIDLVLMDILMNDGSNGLEAAVRIKKNRPGIKIIAVTSMPNHPGSRRQGQLVLKASGIRKHQKRVFLRLWTRRWQVSPFIRTVYRR